MQRIAMPRDSESSAWSVACNALMILAMLVIVAPSDVRAKDEKPKSSKKKAKPKKKYDKNAPWVLPSGRYYEELEAVDVHDEISGEVRIRVKAIPNALHYFMSRECHELDKAGYDDKTLGKKLAAVYRKYKYHKGKALFLVTVSGARSSSRPFYVSKPKRHIEMKTKKKKAAMHYVEEKRSPRAKRWQIYQYVPNAPRKIAKKQLALVDRHSFSFTSRHVSIKHKDPVTITVSGMLGVRTVKNGQGDEGLGVNEKFDQISMLRWRDQVMTPLQVRIYPGRWKAPKPPSRLVELIERLGG
jgi:hypothetical protein